MKVAVDIKLHEFQEDNKISSKERQMTMGRKKFNMDPKKGESKLLVGATILFN